MVLESCAKASLRSAAESERNRTGLFFESVVFILEHGIVHTPASRLNSFR